MKILHVVGARPNFMKVAPVWKAVEEKTTFQQIMVHTGQHYDVNMSDVFFSDLDIPTPGYYLGVGSGSHAQQTAAIMVAFEKVLLETRPDLVLVYGDINSTIAAALVCSKLMFPVAHVEAGLRSFDRTMPEEINRLLTDQIADILFTPSPDGNENLLREGIAPEKIHLVGNVMIDSLVRLQPMAKKSTILETLNLQSGEYAVLTLHRPSNVDNDTILQDLLNGLDSLSQRLPIIFPVHPRARESISRYISSMINHNLQLIEPLNYLDFLRLMSSARMILTDSGGIQEETTYLGIPCLTLRSNTERPITVEMGTNTLVGQDMELLTSRFNALLEDDTTWDRRPPRGILLWEGNAAKRIVNVLNLWYDKP